MLPGKKYTPEDVLKILRKRFWIVVVPWAIVAAGVAGMARKLPDMYKSQAKIQVIPPQVPNSIVQTVAPVSFDQRLQATSQSILSRTRLENIIREAKDTIHLQVYIYDEDETGRKIAEALIAAAKRVVARFTYFRGGGNSDANEAPHHSA